MGFWTFVENYLWNICKMRISFDSKSHVYLAIMNAWTPILDEITFFEISATFEFTNFAQRLTCPIIFHSSFAISFSSDALSSLSRVMCSRI